MPTSVGLRHRTAYLQDRRVTLGPVSLPEAAFRNHLYRSTKLLVFAATPIGRLE